MSFMADLIRQKQNYKWRKVNKHNGTKIQYALDLKMISVGKYTYGDLFVINEAKEHKLVIGDFCSIAWGVTFIVQGEHDTSHISTFPIHRMILKDGLDDAKSKGNIIVGDDVWIGCNATILSGICISQGAVVAAGAVVTTDVPPYAIVGGNPARVIKYRYSQSVIDYLLTFDYSALTEELIRSNIDDMYKSIDDMKLEEIKKTYSWFPKKDIF